MVIYVDVGQHRPLGISCRCLNEEGSEQAAACVFISPSKLV